MSFIGIITDKQSEGEFKSIFNTKFNPNNVIIINNKNISNIRNIKFDTVLINKKISTNRTTENILQNSNNIIVNRDINTNSDALSKYNPTLITYGFNKDSTITASSLEGKALVCLQKDITRSDNTKIEPQEISLENTTKSKNPYVIMGSEAVNIIYGKHK